MAAMRLAEQAKSQPIADSEGLTGRVATVADLKDVQAHVDSLGLSKEKQKEILEKGIATDEYNALRLLQILKDEASGKKVDELNGDKFKYSLSNLTSKWKDGEVELCGMWDKNNRFIGISVGSENTVEANALRGSLAGGVFIHNHPTAGTVRANGEVVPSKKLGLPFSDQDVSSFRDFGLRMSVVTAKEGTYIMERTSSRVAVTDKQITIAWLKSGARRELAKRTFPERKDGTRSDDFARVVWRDIHNTNKELASLGGYKYTFIPNKGYESLTDPSKSGKLPN
jgi:hypothetical protein